VKVLHLLLGELDLLERCGDLLKGQVAPLPALDEQGAQLVGVLEPGVAADPRARLVAAGGLFPRFGAVVADQQNLPLLDTPAPSFPLALGVRAARSIGADLTASAR
jgi:hypothetical protein